MMEITFNDKKSFSDLDVTINSFNISPPSKKKIKEEVPFMNSSYDFSVIGTNGEQVYNNRIIKIKFNLNQKNRRSLYNKYSEMLGWLLDSGQSQLVFSDMNDCYYLAEVENAPNFETIIKRAGIMEVEFVAEPFKTGTDIVGNELWDNINFDTFKFQNTTYSVSGITTLNIFNEGRIITPDVVVSNSMLCTINGYTANFTTSKSKDYKFKLLNGNNNITVNGTGTIEFRFRKQVI